MSFMKNGQLIELFPAFREIQDDELRTRAATAMLLAMEQGGWNFDNINVCPVTMNWLECDVTWVEHVTDVTQLCIMQFDALSKYYNRHHVPFNRDTVICGALLHDIGKLTEYVFSNGSAVHGMNYKLMRHPLSGALIAKQAGLPTEIVHLIATHSFEGEKAYQTAESSFVRTIDLFVFNCSVQGLEKKS